ncbi:putative lipoprotein LpqV [Mycobacterium shigaense]|uniref:Putative lipoprotein LpqV n=1 Tax=Mycobacterium shigaense TaxID=722731 RepID=A0A1Z4EM45_9MYCO|nr:putative lipoprotein LpqV [Mycobacterium shigaense]
MVAAGLAGLLGLTACGHGTPGGPATSSAARPSTVARAPSQAPPGMVGLSPAGVTTRVDVPAESTEEEYYQACHAAKVWMDAQPKAGGQSLLEPYLAMVQAAPSGTPGSWNARWVELTPARQAAVITAARAAAGDECG